VWVVKLIARFSLGTRGAREKLGKRETPKGDFASAEATYTAQAEQWATPLRFAFCALDGRRLFSKSWAKNLKKTSP
jgi:hypothetical protein